MLKISKKQARKFILIKQGLYGPYKFIGKKGIVDYINQAGCIQFDPIDICGKNHELVLQSRVDNFGKSQLYELLYKDRLLMDLFDKNMAIVSINDWPQLDHYREYYRNGGRGKADIDRISGDVIDYINRSGPSCSADIPYNEKVNWSWGPTSLSRAALDTLYFRGDLIIHHKKNVRKYYDLAKKHVPEHILNATNSNVSPEEKHDWYLLRRIKSVGMLWNRTSDALLGISNFKALQRNASFQRLLSAGLIHELIIDGISFPLYVSSDDEELLNKAIKTEEKSMRTEFIAPLDNMMWDRRLIKELFGFSYKWEIYTPAKERKFGYYILPLLHGDKLVGRVEIKKNPSTRSHDISNIWFEEKIRETKKLHKAIQKRLIKFNRFYYL